MKKIGLLALIILSTQAFYSLADDIAKEDIENVTHGTEKGVEWYAGTLPHGDIITALKFTDGEHKGETAAVLTTTEQKDLDDGNSYFEILKELYTPKSE